MLSTQNCAAVIVDAKRLVIRSCAYVLVDGSNESYHHKNNTKGGGHQPSVIPRAGQTSNHGFARCFR